MSKTQAFDFFFKPKIFIPVALKGFVTVLHKRGIFFGRSHQRQEYNIMKLTKNHISFVLFIYLFSS
jgi:hypothetical protein